MHYKCYSDGYHILYKIKYWLKGSSFLWMKICSWITQHDTTWISCVPIINVNCKIFKFCRLFKHIKY